MKKQGFESFILQSNYSSRSRKTNVEKKPRTIYIDCTVTVHSGLNTGIQRVVRNILKRISLLSETFTVPCIPVFFAFGRIWMIKDSFTTLSKYSDRKHWMDRLIKKIKTFVDYYIFIKLINLIREGKLKRVLKKVFSGLYIMQKSLLHRVKDFLSFIMFMVSVKKHSINISKGDLLLAADAFWTYDVVGHLEDLSRRGVSIVSVIYDLIPIYYPNYVDENYAKAFNAYLDRMLAISDGVIGISETTKGNIIDYLEKKNDRTLKDITVDYFYLGFDLEKEREDKTKADSIRKWPDALWSGENVYLMVGTIEPRKGYGLVLDAFERMWSEGSRWRLLIIGRIGWKCEDLIMRFNSGSYRDSRLFVFHDINDEELIYCYDHATALIFASRVEGFGLPLVEAMGRGIPVVASDIPIFKEIGGDYPIYFSVDSVDSLIESIRSVSGRRTKRRDWISWDESVKALMTKTLSIYARQVGGSA